MRSFIINILSAGATFILLVLVSCTPQMCFEETNAYLKASFYLETTGKLQAPDSLTLIGAGMDTARYKKAARVQPALIPLNASAGDCVFLMKINGITDTISFQYTSYPHPISKECGYTFYHSLDSVFSTKNIIDTILIKQRTITTLNEQNILIYY
jgi:predicted nucleic-acid-binding Zn-ribbon protein